MSTDNETAALAGQVDATLEKVYGRMDGFAAEVKQFVAKQQDKWKAASDTHKDLHSGLASLRGDTVRRHGVFMSSRPPARWLVKWTCVAGRRR